MPLDDYLPNTTAENKLETAREHIDDVANAIISKQQDSAEDDVASNTASRLFAIEKELSFLTTVIKEL